MVQMARGTSRLMLGLTLLVGVGCAKPKMTDDNVAPAPSSGGPFTVYVSVANQGFFDVNVFVLRTGDSYGRRLGTVTGNSTVTLKFPDTDLQPGWRLQLGVRAIGSRATWTTPTLAISPGNVARLILISGNNGELSRSQFFLESGSDVLLQPALRSGR
jgi:hypothetical protein